MCGIVGALAQRNVYPILIEGLRRLEYRGYDSAGYSVVSKTGLQTRKAVGKVVELEQAAAADPADGHVGIAHTRWATHGEPSNANCHPHNSGTVSVVHNGIIENHEALRGELQIEGYQFQSQTDTEVVAHLLHRARKTSDSLLSAVQAVLPLLEGAYALAVIDAAAPDQLVATRSGSPLVLGVGIGELFVASDQMALRQVTDRVVFLAEGDIVAILGDSYQLYSSQTGERVERAVVQLSEKDALADKAGYRHFMLKEIFEQSSMLRQTLQGRLSRERVITAAFGHRAEQLFKSAAHIHIIACGTSYHSGMVAKYWLEQLAGLPCQVEVASEYRYRTVAVPADTLFISISQSGETADTLAALRKARDAGYLGFLAICNVANSSLVRESDIALMTHAGPEIGVASTKAFTTQLVALQLVALSIGRARGLSAAVEQQWVAALHQLPDLVATILALDAEIALVAEHFADKNHALFLGRGEQYPIAQEGALKLKEISYIHAEAYPAGELKHGPLALVDEQMPVVAVAPNNELLEKLKSNLHEVRARGGQLYVFADRDAGFSSEPGITVIAMPHVPQSLEAILYTLPLQLLSYHVAVLKGTDVDQPRNLAKSVTVE